MSDALTRLNAALAGRYRALRQLGEGGMAVVYLADDLKHERKVALKVLKPELAAVVGAERFLAEIRTTASLQHPHILPLFDSGSADGFLFYVMPYVEGESLRDRLDREHQLSVEEAVRMVANVAHALDHAHRRGVIHRDIKPANVLVLDGQPMISDFGIALAVTAGGAGRLTETGLSLGTPHYMSPEQATGDQTVGPATDIWALGCVLYEMLVGEPPYTGGTPQAILGRIIAGEPVPVHEHRKSVPANVEAVIRRALEKVPADRFASGGEMAKALAEPGFRHGSERGRAIGEGARWKRLSITTSATTALLLVALAWSLLRPVPRSAVERFPNPFLPGEEPIALTGSFDLSSDGTMLVYERQEAAETRLMVRRWEDLAATPVRDTDGASRPVFSPDGASLAFIQDGQVRVLDLSGGPVRTLGPGATPHWALDGHLYARSGSAIRYPEAGGPSEVVSAREEGEGGRRIHAILPDGRRALLGRTPGSGFEMLTIDLATAETRVLGPGEQPRYARSGHLLYLLDQTLMAAAFDGVRGELTGPGTPLIDGVQYYSLADDGRLFYSTLTAAARVVELLWVTQAGEVSRVDSTWTFDRGENEAWSVSSDGSRIAFRQRASDGSYGIWVRDLRRGNSIPLTDDEGDVGWPVWTGENEVAYTATARVGAATEVKSRRSDGVGDPQLVASIAAGILLNAGDGVLVFGDGASQDIRWFRPGVDAEPRPLLADPDYQERSPADSPDGRWIAYATNESGRLEVEVRPFPEVENFRWTISQNGGNSPKWSASGDEIFFRAPDGTMMAVRVRAGGTFDHDPPRPLFPIPDGIDVPGARLAYEVTSDGRFMMSRRLDRGAPDTLPGFVLVTNFLEELKERVPVP
jgi:serine/threonine-protein kinase